MKTTASLSWPAFEEAERMVSRHGPCCGAASSRPVQPSHFSPGNSGRRCLSSRQRSAFQSPGCPDRLSCWCGLGYSPYFLDSLSPREHSGASFLTQGSCSRWLKCCHLPGDKSQNFLFRMKRLLCSPRQQCLERPFVLGFISEF